MLTIDEPLIWRPSGGYDPTHPYTGDGGNTVFRGQDMIYEGSGRDVYLRTWRGVTQFDEVSPPMPVALTGTVATTANASLLVGTGTKFTQELIVDQWILVGGDIWNVYSIDDDTHLNISDFFSATAPGLTAYRPQTVMEVDNVRGNLIRGNIIRFPNGNILALGDGVLRFNGNVLSSSISASKRLTLGLFNPATSTGVNSGFTGYPLGMAVPTAVSAAAVAGGSKNMQPGTYSVRIVPARTVTAGYNNPSPKAEVVLAAVGDQIQITFPAMDTASGQDSWDVYVSLFDNGSEDTGTQGPWFYYTTVTTSQVSSGGGNFTIEYNDGDVSSRLLTFNNDPPPDAIFVATLQGLPILLSCNGPGRKLQGTADTTATVATVTGTGTTFATDIQRGQLIYIDGKLYTVLTVTSGTSIDVDPAPLATASGLSISLADTAPGPVIRPAKPAINGANVEAFPASFKVAVDPPENIVAWCRGAEGRIFVGTENYIHLVSSTGDPDLPVTVRPYWRAGVRNTQALLFVNDTLFAFTVNGPTRSVGAGDESIGEHSFAAPVAAVFQSWTPERVRIGYDPKNEAVCFFYSGPGVGASGFRGSACLMYMLRLGIWSPQIILESTSGDRSITGVATVAGKLVLTISGHNYQWDVGTEAVAAYIATPPMDAGDPGTDKTITGLQMTGYSQALVNAGVWACGAGEDFPLSDLENGINPASGTLVFAQGSGVRTSFLEPANVPRARLFAVRVNLDWLGSGEPARLDALRMRGNFTGKVY